MMTSRLQPIDDVTGAPVDNAMTGAPVDDVHVAPVQNVSVAPVDDDIGAPIDDGTGAPADDALTSTIVHLRSNTQEPSALLANKCNEKEHYCSIYRRFRLR